MMRNRLRVGVVLAAVLLLGLGAPASAASAVTDTITQSADALPPGYDPSKGKWRKWMINVLSSQLGNAAPDPWQREQIANQYQFNHNFWDGLNKKHGYNSQNPEYLTRPQTVDEYHISQWEQEMKQKGGTGGKAHAVPATKPTKWQKTAKAGGALMALTAFPLGTMLGTAGVDLVGGWFGFDGDSLACSGSIDTGFVELLTGRDCESVFAFNKDYEFPGPSKAHCVRMGEDRSVVCLAVRLAELKGTPLNWSQWFCLVDVGYPGAEAEFPVSKKARIFVSEKGGPEVAPGALTIPENWGGWPVPPDHPSGCTQGITWSVKFKDDEPRGTLEIKRIEVTALDGKVSNAFSLDEEELESFFDCTVTYTDGSSLTSTGASFYPSAGLISPPPCPGTPDGKIPDEVSITDETGEEVSRQEVLPETKDWFENFPECGLGACKLDLIKKPKASCFDIEEGCVGWWEDPNKNDVYQCRYGVKDVAIEECAVYAGLFEEGRVGTSTEYTDPETGEWSGGVNTKGKDQSAYGTAIQNPDRARTCKEINVKGFDPIGFIMRPVQCALEWAFVPRPAVVEVGLAGGEAAWKKKPPAVIAGAVGQWRVTPTASGCKKTVTIFSGQFESSISPVDACAGSWSEPVAAVSRIATSAGMVVLVVVVLRRQISGMVGYGAGQ
ncbi:hypothetical protein ACXR2T_12045 [Leucobacter sp. HY1910]